MDEITASVDISDDFIGVFDNSCPIQLCDELKKTFDVYSTMDGFVYSRKESSNASKLQKEDASINVSGVNAIREINIRMHAHSFGGWFWKNCYIPYAEKFSILNNFDTHKILDFKLQKTTPGQGYHIWHCENMHRDMSDRILAFILYLNDIDDGGETEFLYQKRRIKPKKARCVLWPASFTHVHRGNPPLSADKYILTGWVQF